MNRGYRVIECTHVSERLFRVAAADIRNIGNWPRGIDAVAHRQLHDIEPDIRELDLISLITVYYTFVIYCILAILLSQQLYKLFRLCSLIQNLRPIDPIPYL